MLSGEVKAWVDAPEASALDIHKVDLEVSAGFEDCDRYEGEGALHVYIYAYWARGTRVKEGSVIYEVPVRDVTEPIRVRHIRSPPTSILNGLVKLHKNPQIEITVTTNKSIDQDGRGIAECGPWKSELLLLQRQFEAAETFTFVVSEGVIWDIERFNAEFAAMQQRPNKRRRLNQPS